MKQVGLTYRWIASDADFNKFVVKFNTFLVATLISLWVLCRERKPVLIAIDEMEISKLTFRVIDNVLFLLEYGRIFWYDSKDNLWRRLKGVTDLPFHCFKMVDHGGKIVVLWEEYDVCHGNMLWAAEISLERRHGYEIWGNEIWGKVEWFDIVLTVPMLWKVFNVNAISATV